MMITVIRANFSETKSRSSSKASTECAYYNLEGKR